MDKQIVIKFDKWFSPLNTNLIILPSSVNDSDVAAHLSKATGKLIDVLRYDSDDNRSNNARITVDDFVQYECDILVGTALT